MVMGGHPVPLTRQYIDPIDATYFSKRYVWKVRHDFHSLGLLNRPASLAFSLDYPATGIDCYLTNTIWPRWKDA
jgi:hypothetical protein